MSRFADPRAKGPKDIIYMFELIEKKWNKIQMNRVRQLFEYALGEKWPIEDFLGNPTIDDSRIFITRMNKSEKSKNWCELTKNFFIHCLVPICTDGDSCGISEENLPVAYAAFVAHMRAPSYEFSACVTFARKVMGIYWSNRKNNIDRVNKMFEEFEAKAPAQARYLQYTINNSSKARKNVQWICEYFTRSI